MRPLIAVVLLALATIAAVPCARGQASTPFTFSKTDVKLWDESEALDRQFEKRALVYHDAELEKYLAGLAAPMLPSSPLERVKWQFHILRDPMANAFALPNGSVYVTSGLFARAENDDQLASVLAHEITHVTNRHTYTFARSTRKKIVTLEIIALIADWTPAGGLAQAVAATVASNASSVFIVTMVYGYSRKLEEEADQTGMDAMKRAGRSPAQMVRMFELFDDKLEPEPVPRFFLDHPRVKDRIGYLKTLSGGDSAPSSDDPAYLDRLHAVILQNIQLDLDSRRFRSAVAAANRLATARPDDAVALYWQGESYRLLGPHQPRLSQQEQTNAGLREGYQQTVKRTEEEETKALAATPAGRAAFQSNQSMAEDALRKAIAIDASQADPYFSLGALYEEQGKTTAALDAYGKYVSLCQKPAEAERAKRRIAELSQTKPGGGK